MGSKMDFNDGAAGSLSASERADVVSTFATDGAKKEPGTCFGPATAEGASIIEDGGVNALRIEAATSTLKAEFPKIHCMLTDASGQSILPRALLTFWRSQDLPTMAPEEEGDPLAAKLERLLIFLRGEARGLLEVRPSLIPNAGDGLFVVRPVPAGAWLCVYSGTAVPLAELVKAKERGDSLSDYLMGGFGLYSVDAADHLDVLARYVNDCYQNPDARNVRFVKLARAKKALVVSLRALEPGEELYADYGECYWRARGVTVRTASPDL